MTKVAIAPGGYAGLHKEVASVVESARGTAARNVNAVMTAAYWEIGRRIVAREQGGQARAGYGQALIARLADDPDAPFRTRVRQGESGQHARLLWRLARDRGFQDSVWKIGRPRKCPDAVWKIAAGERRRRRHGNGAGLHGASHPFYVAMVRVCAPAFREDGGRRAFYETEALREGWSVRQLDRQIGSHFYERLALSRNKAALLRKAGDVQPGDIMTPEEAIRDPFVLEFLDVGFAPAADEEGLQMRKKI
ncbi:DUF1016 N-terminal domain-containing protein [Paraburkholderia sp. BL17N1]|uniref:DUF1016 N-terminal domain-containing protein n=1 Tax=Paraburkholderia sp. BL17N1 TaxID=1938798 RepID=UPI000F25939B|nr:uncharacterized protein DUF1016 [Paraburkholderia sp. BL17N1]